MADGNRIANALVAFLDARERLEDKECRAAEWPRDLKKARQLERARDGYQEARRELVAALEDK
jgi:hypothetical protein